MTEWWLTTETCLSCRRKDESNSVLQRQRRQTVLQINDAAGSRRGPAVSPTDKSGFLLVLQVTSDSRRTEKKSTRDSATYRAINANLHRRNSASLSGANWVGQLRVSAWTVRPLVASPAADYANPRERGNLATGLNELPREAV